MKIKFGLHVKQVNNNSKTIRYRIFVDDNEIFSSYNDGEEEKFEKLMEKIQVNPYWPSFPKELNPQNYTSSMSFAEFGKTAETLGITYANFLQKLYSSAKELSIDEIFYSECDLD